MNIGTGSYPAIQLFTFTCDPQVKHEAAPAPNEFGQFLSDRLFVLSWPVGTSSHDYTSPHIKFYQVRNFVNLRRFEHNSASCCALIPKSLDLGTIWEAVETHHRRRDRIKISTTSSWWNPIDIGLARTRHRMQEITRKSSHNVLWNKASIKQICDRTNSQPLPPPPPQLVRRG